MIRYHGTPITPAAAASEVLTGRHGMVSFAHTEQLSIVSELCQSFAIDNGAFSFWRSSKPFNWEDYKSFVDELRHHPGFDWAIIPDVIEGKESENMKLCDSWPFSENISVPVWHMHESLDYLKYLSDNWFRIAIGSSGEYQWPGSRAWVNRMDAAFEILTDEQGRPKNKIHGLRMMARKIVARYPLSSVDSCNVARNIGIDKHWGKLDDLPKSVRAVVLASRSESCQSVSTWSTKRPESEGLLF